MEIVRLSERRHFSSDRMQKRNLFETRHFFLDCYCLEPGQSQKPHHHKNNDKVYLVLEGSGRVQVGDEASTLGPGEAVLAAAGQEHGLWNPGPDRLVVLAFMAPHPDHSRDPADVAPERADDPGRSPVGDAGS